LKVLYQHSPGALRISGHVSITRPTIESCVLNARISTCQVQFVRRFILHRTKYNYVKIWVHVFPSDLARTANGVTVCHWVQFYRYFVSQSSEFCHRNPFCCFSTSNVNGEHMFRNRLSPGTCGYTLIYWWCL